MRARAMLLTGLIAALAAAGCSSSETGQATKAEGDQGANKQNSSAPPTSSAGESSAAAPAGGPPACDVLSTDAVAKAYEVNGGVESSESTPTNNGGVQIKTCRYVHKGIIVAGLQVGSGPSQAGGGAAGVLKQVRLGMASSGADTTAEEIPGVGDAAEYLPNVNAKQRTMLAVKRADGENFALVIIGLAKKQGLDDKTALTELANEALSAM